MANTSHTTTEVRAINNNVNITHGLVYPTMVAGGFDWDIYWAEMRANPVYQAGEFLKQYTTIILAGIGVPCNLLTLLIMTRFKPITSGTLIMMILAAADITNLLFNSFLGRKMYNIFASDASCQAYVTAHILLLYIPIWLVIMLTLERVVAVCYPMKAARLCTVSNVRKGVIILLILDASLCAVYTFVYELIVSDEQKWCKIKARYAGLMHAWTKVDAIVFSVIPLLLLSAGNIAIVIKLRSAGDRDKLTGGATSRDETKRQNRSVTRMLLAVSITTIACVGPNAALGFGGGVRWINVLTGDVNFDAMKYLGYYIIIFITYINNAVNFFLYVLSGRRFRAVFLQMMTACHASRGSIYGNNIGNVDIIS